MADKALPSPEVLRQLLRYEPETGKLFWRERGPEWFDVVGRISPEDFARNWNLRHAGKEAFTSPSRVYASGTVLKVSIMAHRAAWAIHFGEWPVAQLDHINGDKKDNRLCNLRQVSPAENMKNKPTQKNSTSGHLGVRWVENRSKWRANIGRNTHLGMFETKEAAISARLAAEQQMGFHENHGRKTA